MITSELQIINGKKYIHTYSDKYYIEKDGVEYTSAIDVEENATEYVETEKPLPLFCIMFQKSQLFDIITGGEPV